MCLFMSIFTALCHTLIIYLLRTLIIPETAIMIINTGAPWLQDTNWLKTRGSGLAVTHYASARHFGATDLSLLGITPPDTPALAGS